MKNTKTQAGQTVPLDSLVRPNIRETEDFERSCDQCDCQEDGGHYCLLHGVQMKNMNIMTCDDWEEKKSNATLHLPTEAQRKEVR